MPGKCGPVVRYNWSCMSDIFAAIILGIVEGLTEFLPVSSTGHLILAGELLGRNGRAWETFEVVIQLGAILAVVVLYRQRFFGLLRHNAQQPFSGLRGIGLLFITCLPAGIVGLVFHSVIKAHLFGTTTVLCALVAGAALMIVVEKRKPAPRYASLDEVTPKLAFAIGCFQCLALWPGFSRSASTMIGGMLFGADRRLAADYSFMAAVPIMFAATGYDLLKNLDAITGDFASVLAVGFVVSFIAALAAIKVFIGVVGRLGLVPFAWYRLVLAFLFGVFWLLK